MIKGEKIYLRAVEPEDIDNLYLWENDPAIWRVSLLSMLYSKFVLKEYIENSSKSIYEIGQQRFMICLCGDDSAIGTIDLFDFDAHNQRAGLGILIYDDKNRGKGYAKEAITLVEYYARENLNMHQLYCNISEDNSASISLFSSLNYQLCGTKKEWLNIKGAWLSEHLFQKIF